MSHMKEGDWTLRLALGRRSAAPPLLRSQILFAGAVAIVVWLIADDAGLTMGDTVIPVLVGGAVGLVVAIVLVLAVSRFRAAFSRMRTPSVLLLGGLGL
jgi:hypothetical protein